MHSAADILELQRLVLDFALRDRGEWDRLRALFTPQASIHVTWYSGPVDGFVAASRGMAEAGAPPSKHLIATPRVDIAGERAVGETDIVIAVRMPVPEGEIDTTSWARFHDLFERRDGRWRIAKRTAVYEKDRADPVGATVLGAGWTTADLARFPQAYKHLANLLDRMGRKLAAGIAVAGSEEERAIAMEARDWLAQSTAG